MSPRIRLLSALAAMTLSAAFCEMVLQLAAATIPLIRYQISPPWSRNLIPDSALGYRMSPYYFGHDRRGYRNGDALDRYDLAAVGDSTTYGFGAGADGSWPRHLQRLSGRSVYNAGVGGYGPCEYSLVVDEVLELQPKAVILAIYLGNDIADAYTSVYLENRCPDVKSRDASTVAAMGYADQKKALRELAKQYTDSEPEAEPPPSLLKRSGLYGLARSAAYQLRTTNRTPFREGDDSFGAAARRRLRIPLGAPSTFRTVFLDPRHQAVAVDLSDARIAEGLRVTLAEIEVIRRKLHDRGVELVVALLHDKAVVLGPVIRRNRPDLWPTFEHFVSLESVVAERISGWLLENRIPHVDTATGFERALVDGVMPFHDSDDHHPNTRGYEAIADAIWREIARLAPR